MTEYETLTPIEVSLEESKINFVEYEEKTIELFGETFGTFVTEEDSFDLRFCYTLPNGSLIIHFYNSKNIERLLITYDVDKGVNTVSTFTILDQVIELTLFVGGETTPFTRESFIELIESEANYCNRFEQAEGNISKHINFDEHCENRLLYFANSVSNNQELIVEGVTKASMPPKFTQPI